MQAVILLKLVKVTPEVLNIHKYFLCSFFPSGVLFHLELPTVLALLKAELESKTLFSENGLIRHFGVKKPLSSIMRNALSLDLIVNFIYL